MRGGHLVCDDFRGAAGARKYCTAHPDEPRVKVHVRGWHWPELCKMRGGKGIEGTVAPQFPVALFDWHHSLDLRAGL